MSDLKKSSEAQTTTTETNLLDDILAETRLQKSDEGYDVAKRGVEVLIGELLKPAHASERVDKSLLDGLIAVLDAKISAQVNEVMHEPSFQKMESAWRGLKFVVDRTDFRENIRVEVLNLSKSDLLTDFEDAPEVTKSGLYKIVYSAEYGQFGGKPYGAVFSNYEVGPGAQDVALLQKAAAVAAMSHAPFFAAAGPQFFGLTDFLGMPNLKDLESHFEGPQYAKWRALRESEDARYLGVTLPRFLLRLPYGATTVPAKSFGYE